nr:interferon-induced very large GTPase 1-like [Pogona vitticeps]
MASCGSPFEIIQNARKKLREALLQIDVALLLDAVDSHLLLSQREFFSLSEIKDSEKCIERLIDVILGKGKSKQELFLDCLENLRHVFPCLQPISEYLEEDSEQTTLQEIQKEDFAKTRKIPELISSGNSLCSEETKENRNVDVSLGMSVKGSTDSAMISGEEMIRKGRKQLTEILENDIELFLDELVSQSVITEEEYEILDKIEENSKKKIRKLLIQIQKKGEPACIQFLECLEIIHPGSNCILQRSVHGSSLEQLLSEEEAENPVAVEEAKRDISEGLSSQEKEEIREEPEEVQKHPPGERRKALKTILTKLKLRKHKSKKLALQEILEISSGSLKECRSAALGDLPWHFLRKVLALNVSARNTTVEEENLEQRMKVKEEEKRVDERIFFNSETDVRVSVNPLDVLCAVLLCSDSFLQQEIFSKMSLCQFALPLLLPPLETPKCTLMLWAMRGIVKQWTPHSLAESKGFREENLVLTPMPVISFVRMGTSTFSKSAVLNEFLSPSQQHNDYFIHRDSESGNIPREIAEGLVEIAWYFPGQKSSDLFPEPLAVTNLRGDAESHWVQFSFLTQVSSAVFIFADCISEREYILLYIMDYDPEMHNWYIPGLWHGVPPMAPVNRGYSEKVFELKKSLFEFIKDRSHKRPPKDIPQFIEWVKSLWRAVKHENFIFSFRNSLIAEAYNQLSMKYSEWDWHFRREMHLWVSEQETVIQNVDLDELDHSNWKNDLQAKLSSGEQRMLQHLEEYFESGAANLHLVERYKEDFIRSASSLKRELENYSSTKCIEAIRIKKGRHKIDTLQIEYLKIFEGKVDKLLEDCRKNEYRLEDEELKKEFERMWAETLSAISPTPLENRQILSDIELSLRKELAHRGSLVNLKVQEAKCLLNYSISTFQMKPEYLETSIIYRVRHFFAKKDRWHKAEELARSLMTLCSSYINEKVCCRGDYDETYCVELLHMINEKLQESDVQKLHITACFEIDLKLHILGEATHSFQKMHDDFIKENDPHVRLENLRPQYFSVFRDLYLEKDALQNRAKDFCEHCLYPSIVDYINKRLGIEIVNDILTSSQSIGYASRSFFQFCVLKELLEERDVNKFVNYIMEYETFVKGWIKGQIFDHYAENDLKDLEKEIVSHIVKKIRETLESMTHKSIETLSEFLDNFCQQMQKELVISKDNLMGIQFKNTFDPCQFSAWVGKFLPDLQMQIQSDFAALEIKSKLSNLSVKPQCELFNRVFGCGKQCPFCKVPCEAGGSAHKEHFAAIHRPQGLGRYRNESSEELVHSICSTDVVSNSTFRNWDTDWEWHPYKDYRDYYPDWCIQPDPSINASDYWKFVLKEFNCDFARCYNAKPADLPEDWKNISQEQALEAIKETYNMN